MQLPLYGRKLEDGIWMWVCKVTKAKHVAVTLNIMNQKKQFGVSAVLILVWAPFALSGG